MSNREKIMNLCKITEAEKVTCWNAPRLLISKVAHVYCQDKINNWYR